MTETERKVYKRPSSAVSRQRPAAIQQGGRVRPMSATVTRKEKEVFRSKHALRPPPPPKRPTSAGKSQASYAAAMLDYRRDAFEGALLTSKNTMSAQSQFMQQLRASTSTLIRDERSAEHLRAMRAAALDLTARMKADTLIEEAAPHIKRTKYAMARVERALRMKDKKKTEAWFAKLEERISHLSDTKFDKLKEVRAVQRQFYALHRTLRAADYTFSVTSETQTQESTLAVELTLRAPVDSSDDEDEIARKRGEQQRQLLGRDFAAAAIESALGKAGGDKSKSGKNGQLSARSDATDDSEGSYAPPGVVPERDAPVQIEASSDSKKTLAGAVVRRGRTGRRVSVSAEAMPARFRAAPAVMQNAPKSAVEKKFIVNSLKSNFLFKTLDPECLTDVYDAMIEVTRNAKDVIIKQGEDGDNLYILREGEIEVWVASHGAAPAKVATLQPGAAFGELALMYNCPRAATCVAKTPVKMWAVDRSNFRRIVTGAQQSKIQLYLKFLRNVKLLKSLTKEELANIADALIPLEYPSGTYIIKAGTSGDMFYILEKGEVSVTKPLAPGIPSVEVGRLKPGAYFGEISLMTDKPRQANVVAATDVTVLGLDRACFQRLLGSAEEIMRRNMADY